MSRLIHCIKLNKEAEGLTRPPYPNELGRRLYDSVSQEAWGMWMEQQTRLINEHRLNPVDPKARQFLEQQMELFFFGSDPH